jgi:hypothetical protein
MADGITRHFVAEDELGQWFAQRYGLTIADCSDSVGARLRDDGEPYQLLTIWNLENRQRRFIGGHMALLGPRYHLVTPVYSSEMLRAWLEIPRLGLEGRAFYRQMLACLYPATARIPHAEEEHPIIPNFKWLSREYLRWGAKTLRWRLPGLPGVRSFARLMGAGEDSDIWSRSYSITPQDRAEMEIAVRTADRNCQDVLDFSPVDFLQGASKPTPRVCRIAWAVASYAEMLSARD